MYANIYGLPLSSWAQYEPRPMTTHLQPVKTPYEIVKLQLYTAFEEAGRLAGYYSSGRTAPKVEIDYIQKKHVKKPNGSKPGFVVYYTNYSLIIEPDISGIQLVEE